MAQTSSEVEPVVAPFELRPGVMIDPAADAAYLMNPQRGIDKIDLSSGKLLWSTSNAAKPVAVFDDRLVARADSHAPDIHLLPLLMLATNDGAPVSRIAIPLPAEVVPTIDDRLGASFTTQTRVEQDRLTLWWGYSRQTISGVLRPGPEPPQLNENGAVSINLRTDHVENLTPQQGTAAMRGSRKTPPTTPSDAFLTPPQLAGKFFFTTKLEPGRMILKRWNAESGAPLPDIELGPKFAVAIASADGADLVTANAVGANAVGIENYLWTIYSLATGERVAEIRLPQSPAPCFLWHSMLIYESQPVSQRVNGVMQREPLEVCALDRRTAAPVWKRAIRDTGYHGPYPPRPY